MPELSSHKIACDPLKKEIASLASIRIGDKHTFKLSHTFPGRSVSTTLSGPDWSVRYDDRTKELEAKKSFLLRNGGKLELQQQIPGSKAGPSWAALPSPKFLLHTGKWLTVSDLAASTSFSYDSQFRKGRVLQTLDFGKRYQMKVALQHSAQKALESHDSHTMEAMATVHWDTSHAIKSLSVLHHHKDGLSCSISASPTERLRVKSTYTLNSQVLKSSISLLPREKIGTTLMLDTKLDVKKQIFPSAILSLAYAV